MRWLGLVFLLAACSLSAQTSVVPEIQPRLAQWERKSRGGRGLLADSTQKADGPDPLLEKNARSIHVECGS